MSYGTSESAGEKAIGQDQDKRENWGEGEGKEGASTVHESNPPALAAKPYKFACTRVYLYTESRSRGRNEHTPEIELSIVIGQN